LSTTVKLKSFGVGSVGAIKLAVAPFASLSPTGVPAVCCQR